MTKKIVSLIKSRDPSMRSAWEAWLYPGIWAVFAHRYAHRLYKRKRFFAARLVSMVSRWVTGIEIHPGAKIGRGVFIDHGMGVVIGETCVIGDNVLIYHGVTLGATGKEQDKTRRHPCIGNNVVIGASALVLGAVTVGDGAKIGAGAVVVSDVPPGATAVCGTARITNKKTETR